LFIEKLICLSTSPLFESINFLGWGLFSTIGLSCWCILTLSVVLDGWLLYKKCLVARNF